MQSALSIISALTMFFSQKLYNIYKEAKITITIIIFYKKDLYDLLTWSCLKKISKLNKKKLFEKKKLFSLDKKPVGKNTLMTTRKKDIVFRQPMPITRDTIRSICTTAFHRRRCI